MLRSWANELWWRVAFELRRRFSRRIVVIESDDWGLEMAVDERALARFRDRQPAGSITRWSTDALETPEDLTMLFDVLEKHRGVFYKPPVITANFVTHNVDYSCGDGLRFKPLSGGFNDGSVDVRPLYREGIRNGYVWPELHGYCHYDGGKLASYFETEAGRAAFDARFLAGEATLRGRLSLLRGEFGDANSRSASKVADAQRVFSAVFGRSATSIIPPHFIFDRRFTAILPAHRIVGIQASNRIVTDSGAAYAAPFFRPRRGLVWTPRNCRLDPHPDYGYGAARCLHDIRRAFADEMPAVVDCHRVNFSGRFAPEYRDRSLREFDGLLTGIRHEWPDVEFWTSAELLTACLKEN